MFMYISKHQHVLIFMRDERAPGLARARVEEAKAPRGPVLGAAKQNPIIYSIYIYIVYDVVYIVYTMF